jgi:hypothetical protein
MLMRYRNFDVLKSLRLPADDADWLAKTSCETRRSEGEIIRSALKAMREKAADTPREGEI